MKRILKTTLVVALVLTATIGMAKDAEVRLSTTKEAKNVVLSLESASKNLMVTFMDAQKNVLYLETLEDGTRYKRFDLQSLESGTYFLTTSDAHKATTYEVVINGDAVTILKNDEVIKPHFRKTEEKIFVNFLNLDRSKVAIKIYDEDYRVVFSETFTEKMIVEKAFDFQGAYAGNYKVVVTNANRTFSEYFLVD